MPTTRADIVTFAADGVGGVSLALGGLLIVAPEAAARVLDLTKTPTDRRRTLGAFDLALGVAIIAGRSQPWRWTAVGARSLLHLAFLREYRSAGRKSAAVAMAALFAIDATVALGLRRQ